MTTKTIPAPLTGKTAILTGGTKGIGLAIAHELTRQGISGLALTYARDETNAQTSQAALLAAGLPSCTLIKADLISPTFGTDIVSATLSGLGVNAVDIVINNAFYAGPAEFLPFEDQTLSSFDNMMHGNVWGPMQLIRAALPVINPGGRVINISSLAARNFNIDPLVVYGATKAALESVTRSLAVIYAAKKNITVNSVSVGPTDTEPGRMSRDFPKEFTALLRNCVDAERDLASPEDVAGIVAFIAGGQSRWVNGCSVMASGGAIVAL